MKIRCRKGYTLVEVMVALGITVTLFGSMLMAFLSVRAMNQMARHKIQAIQVVRGQIENLKAGPFDDIDDALAVVSYDAGPDGVYGNGDDRQGNLTTTVADALDFDGDGNTVEDWISVDGAGANETNARPLRVSFSWNERTLGQDRAMNVFVDTIIAQ